MEEEALFVYGTLMPGHLRWPMLDRHATGVRQWNVRGRLYDTGNGWPAAELVGIDGSGAPADGVSSHVPGWVVSLHPDRLAHLLPGLDEMEGIGTRPGPDHDPYVRIRVDVGPGQVAWAYHAIAVLPGWRLIDEWDDQAEA